MIPTVQFDPGTLAIWTTTGMLEEPTASIAAAAMGAAARGDSPYEILRKIPRDDPLRARLLWLASSVWHEKRHFFDTCLTNYGARRFRNLFNLAANFGPLMAEAHARREPMWLPVELYASRAHRLALGISEPAPNILESARLARAMKSFQEELDAPVRNQGLLLHLGGEAQLEGLAQISQIMSIEHCFGAEDVLAVTMECVHRLPREGPYRAIEAVSGALGCTTDREEQTVVNPALAAALFMTALCGRFYGSGKQVPAERVSPWQRLARMVEELGPKPGRFDMTDEEAAELVDKLALRLWGRTAFDEIAADIEGMEAKVDLDSALWLEVEGLYAAFKDFLALRRRVLESARAAGPASVLPHAFPILWRDNLRPWHVVATPRGEAETDEDEASTVFGVTLNLPRELGQFFPAKVVWGRLYREQGSDPAVFAPRDYSGWIQMLERHGPRAHLMLNGRRHRRMVPPELERPVNEIEEFGVAVRFHPLFEWPEERDYDVRLAEAVVLAEFSGRTKFVCDITGETIQPTEAAVVTPWEFRRSHLVELFRRDQEHIIAEFMLMTDWSDWIVRRDILQPQ